MAYTVSARVSYLKTGVTNMNRKPPPIESKPRMPPPPDLATRESANPPPSLDKWDTPTVGHPRKEAGGRCTIFFPCFVDFAVAKEWADYWQPRLKTPILLIRDDDKKTAVRI